MKLTNRILIISLILLSASAHAYAATGKTPRKGRLSITRLQVQNTGDSIELSFDYSPHLLRIGKKERITVTPVVSDGNRQVKFPSFAITGKKAKTPTVQTYAAAMKYQEWMKGSILAFESSVRLCAKQAMLTTAIVDGRILQDPDVEIVRITEQPQAYKPVPTTADTLARTYDFLADASTKTAPDKESNGEPLRILYRLGSSALSGDYADNARNLGLLVDVINRINRSSDSRVSNILIAGYASPEGNARSNANLAESRAVALKEYLMQHTQVAATMFETVNGGADWRGLYGMASKSGMADKEAVLRIISSILTGNERERQNRISELTHLKKGAPYRFMQKNFFPKLRSGTCIQVSYENINNK